MNQSEIKYYVENGKPEVVMDQNTARETRIVIDAYIAGVSNTTYTEETKKMLIAEYIINGFLRDDTSKSMAKSWPGVLTFLQAVEDKTDELLK